MNMKPLNHYYFSDLFLNSRTRLNFLACGVIHTEAESWSISSQMRFEPLVSDKIHLAFTAWTRIRLSQDKQS